MAHDVYEYTGCGQQFLRASGVRTYVVAKSEVVGSVDACPATYVIGRMGISLAPSFPDLVTTLLSLPGACCSGRVVVRKSVSGGFIFWRFVIRGRNSFYCYLLLERG